MTQDGAGKSARLVFAHPDWCKGARMITHRVSQNRRNFELLCNSESCQGHTH